MSSAHFPATCAAAKAKICNQPEYTIDARGNRTDYTYDDDARHGGILTKTLPAGADGVRPQTRYTYQQLSATYFVAPGQFAAGSPIWKLVRTSSCRTQASCSGTADEVVTEIGYDGNLLPKSETVRAGDGSSTATTSKTYDSVGNVIAVDGPQPGSGDTTRYVYNANRELVATMGADPDGAGPLPVLVTRTQYNADGQIYLVESGTAANQSDAALSAMSVFKQAWTDYDAAARKIADRLVANGVTYAVTQYSYDAASRLQCTAVRMNPAVYGSLPASACALGTAGAQGPDRITKNVYDAAGQLLQVQKAFGVTTANGFPTTLQQDYATYTYSLNGMQTSVIDANGNKATMAYDGFDRKIAWSFPTGANGAVTANCTIGAINTVNGITGPSEARGANDDCEKYAYDANGNRAKLMKRDGQVIRYSYDALNRVTLKDIPGGTAKDVYYGYDLRGLQTYARFEAANGAGIDTAYDAFGQVASSTNTMGGVTRTLSYLYDAGGNRTRITHPGGTFFTYEYDGLNRPRTIRENGTTVVAGMAWDAQGRRDGETRGAVSGAYGYDAVSRPITHSDDLAGTADDVTTSFGYNPASQIISRTLSNPAYGFSGYTNVSRAYAANGLNQYSSAGGVSFGYDANGNLTASGSTAYTYDTENRLVSASNGAGLIYDPLGRLFETSFAGGGLTRFLYDGDQLALEYDAAGDVLRRYVHGTGDDDPLLWYEGASLADRRSLQANYQGSIVSVADAAGAAIEINKYDEYGIPAGSNIGRFQYTGQAWIPELGMYHYKARIYSATLGRFLQTDPIGYDDQINLYAYVANDPVNGRDPTGLYECNDGKTQCKLVDAFVKGVKAAANAKGASETLKSISRSLGERGEAGVTISLGTLATGTLGQMEGSSMILDFRQINSAANSIASATGINPYRAFAAVGSAVVGHETKHYENRNVYGSSAKDRVADEKQAYRVQDQIMDHFGVIGNGWRPGLSPYDYNKSVEGRAKRSCIAGMISQGSSSDRATAACTNQ